MKIKTIALASVGFLLLASCGTSSHTNGSTDMTMPHKAQLPISADSWTTWQCPNGNTLRTRYSDRNGQELQLELANGSYRLKHEAGYNPAIYSDGQMGFYSDGKFAAIGRPLSDEIYAGGCVVK